LLREIKCPHACGKSFQRAEMKQHSTEGCMYRLMTCPQCQDSAIFFKDFDDHVQNKCPKNTITCQSVYGDDGCDTKLFRCDLFVHRETVCPKVIVECRFAKFGCTTKKMLRWHMKEHEATEMKNHLELVFTYSEDQYKRMEKTKKSNKRKREPQLKNESPTLTGFVPHLLDPSSLVLGQRYDVRDEMGKWLVGEVIKKDSKELEIKFLGWSSLYNKKVSLLPLQNTLQVAPLRLFSQGRLTEQEKQRFYLENPVRIYSKALSFHEHVGIIKGFIDGRQMRVAWTENGFKNEYWFHIDTDEIRPFA